MIGRRCRRGFTIVELAAVATVGTVLMSLFAPAFQEAREAARRSVCKNNLKQLGLGFHNYHDTYGTFPPGWTNHTPNAGEQWRFGWGASLLPFLDQVRLYRELNFEQPTMTERKVLETALPVYRCPSDLTPVLNPLRGGYAASNYSGSFGMAAIPRLLPGGMNPGWPGEVSTPTSEDWEFIATSGILWCNSHVRVRDCPDGLTYTLMAGERCLTSGSGIWAGVRGNEYENDVVSDCSPGNEINSGLGSFSSRHRGGAQFLMGDGHVRFIVETIDSGTAEKPGLWQTLAGRSDGRAVGSF